MKEENRRAIAMGAIFAIIEALFGVIFTILLGMNDPIIVVYITVSTIISFIAIYYSIQIIDYLRNKIIYRMNDNRYWNGIVGTITHVKELMDKHEIYYFVPSREFAIFITRNFKEIYNKNDTTSVFVFSTDPRNPTIEDSTKDIIAKMINTNTLTHIKGAGLLILSDKLVCNLYPEHKITFKDTLDYVDFRCEECGYKFPFYHNDGLYSSDGMYIPIKDPNHTLR